jgi:subfamily B ATP-binding cassette protein MsbA
VATPPERSLRTLARLFRYARPYIPLVAVTIVFTLLYAGGLTGRAYLTRPLIDDVVAPNLEARSIGDLLESGAAEDPTELERQRVLLEERVAGRLKDLVLAAVVLVLGMPVARLIRDYAGEYVMTRMSVDMQSDLCASVLGLPLSRFDEEGRSDLVARMMSDTAIANRAQMLVFGDAIQHVAIVILATGVAFYLNWQLALVTVMVGPPVGITLQLFGRRIRRTSAARQEQVAQVVGRLVQILGGIRVIKVFRSEPRELSAFRTEAMRYLRRAMRVIRNRVLSRSIVELASQAAFVSMLLLGIYAIVGGLWDLTLGVLTAFLVVSATLYAPTKSLSRAYNSIQNALPAAARLFEILDAPAEPEDPADAVTIHQVREGVRFQDVWFSYGREPVLQGIDLEVRAGEVVAVVGRTGSGKTTVADLLLRFRTPQRGRIEIDGIDIRDIKRDSLRELVTVVPQDPFLFDASLAENIRYGRPDASFEEIVKASRAAHAHEFIEELPEKYDTEVGELGARLSGGQRQRITIARAILRDPEILIFDEATSALDAKAERLIHDAIWNLMKERTVLLIAHRLSTVRGADRIVVVEKGRITDEGTHDELLSRSGLYRDLVELQLAPQSSA